MFNFRRSMNPPRQSTTTPPTSEIPSTPPRDPLPLPPGLSSSFHSHSNSGPQLRTPPSQKNNPYYHHLQQSQSKILGRKTGTKKYPPPIEHKAQTPKRPAPSTPGLIGRVSSLFSSPSSSGGGNLTVPDTTIPEDATSAGENGRDDRSTAPPAKPKRKSLVNKFTKSSPKKSDSISTTPTKIKRVPPPLAMTPSASASSSSSFHPFRSITRSRSKLAQHLLGSFNEPEIDDTGDGDPSSLSSLHLSRTPRSARSPRSPRSPRTPRSPFFYNGESDAESDIRRPSGLGRRVSTSSLPPSPFGGSYPWEVRPNEQGTTKQPKATTESESSKVQDEAVKPEVQEQSNNEKGTLKEKFRFPSNKSVVNLTAESSSPTTSDDSKDRSQRKTGRPRAVSSPGLLLTIGRKVREKLERDRELGKLKDQLSNVQKTNEGANAETSPSNEETTPVQDIQGVQDMQDTLNARDMHDAQDTPDIPGTQNAQELQEAAIQTAQAAVNIQARAFSPAHEPYRASVYSNDSEAGGSRERMMSFSLVHEFPEPPSTHVLAHTRGSSESGPGAFIISPPPVPPVPPLPASAFPLQQVPLEVIPVKRSSSSTMDSSVSATTSTTTATSLGVEGAGSICNAVRARIESCSPREIIVIPTAKTLAPVAQTSNNALSTPCTLYPEPVPFHLPNQILWLALSFLPGKKDIAPLACVNKAYAEVVRSLLYDTLDLEDENTSKMRVQKLLATLVNRKHLTALTTKFVCQEWPEWFPPSPNDLSVAEEFEEESQEDTHELELQNMFLASTLVLVVSRMTGLKELVLPSYHPFLFSDLTPEMRWTELKIVEFTNITLEDEEAREMFAWLDNMSGVEKLSFQRLVESGEAPTRTSNDSISSVRSSKRSSTCSKRMSIPLAPHAAINSKRSSIGTGTLHNSVLLSSVGLGSEEPSRPQQPSLPSLEKYAHSWTFLPNLKVLHAPPRIILLLAASRDEENSQGEERRPWRPLDKVTINIDMTLYTGLRPTALVQSLHGIRWLGLKFGERVDRRTVEKVFVAVGAALGSNGLERLDIEFVSAWAAMTDESLYKIIDTVLPRYPDLRQLKMGYVKREVMTSTDITTFELSPAEETRLSQWMKHCPDLMYVGLLSGSSWKKTTSLI